MDIIFWFVVLAASLFFLTKSSDIFTESAEKIGLWMKISPFIVGVTIVAIGTSLPELFSSIFAVVSGNTEIVAGNVVGSNITNVFLILGVAAIMSRKINIKEAFLRIDLMVLMASALMFIVVAINGVISFFETLILFVGFIIYLTYISKSKKHVEDQDVKPIDVKREKLRVSTYVKLIFSILVLVVSAKYTIDSIVQLAGFLQVGTEIIAATVVAFGTSLPELAVTVAAARKGKADIAVGNILGSNIFNIFAVVGISGLFSELIVPQNIIYVGFLFMVGATLLYFFAVKDRELSAWDGSFLLLLYLLYLSQIVGFA